jgi:hypothetical protein
VFEYAKESNELKANLAALSKATAAIEKGMGGAFVQTNTASVLKKLVQKNENLADADREQVLSFLSGSEEYAPQGGQITGILKTMNDEMSASLADATNAENEAIQAFDSLVAAKTKEINALTKAIEEYEGGVIIISHNREFANAVSQEKWIMEAGRLRKEGESIAKDEEEGMGNKVQEEVKDAFGNTIDVRADNKSDKEFKAELKRIEKQLKDHKKKPYLSDEEKWELEDRRDEIKEKIGASKKK